FGCALTADGTVWCWGFAVGTDPLQSRDTPVAVDGLSGVRTLATSSVADHACAITGDGALWCWGDNSMGQLGVGDIASRAAPTRVPGLAGVVSVAVGSTHTCALASDGALWCWGAAELDQLGGAPAGDTCRRGRIGDASRVPCALAPVRVPAP